VALLTKRTEPERLEERRAEARADIASRSPLATARERVSGVKETLAHGDERDARLPKTKAALRRPDPAVVEIHRTAREPRVRDDDGPPARVVAAAAGLAALIVAVVTSRLPRR
jgi:hypothetical protein